MTDVGPAVGVVHGVGHVSHQDDVLSIPCHLSQAKGSSEDTHVGVNTRQHYIFYLVLGQDIPDLVTSVTDIVLPRVDGDSSVLLLPRHVGITAHRDELFCPLGMLCPVVVFTAV